MPCPWVLEERVCKCGCGKKFRTLPGSKSFYATIHHLPGYQEWVFGSQQFAKSKSMLFKVRELEEKVRRLEEDLY